jgi:hypothetical protein
VRLRGRVIQMGSLFWPLSEQGAILSQVAHNGCLGCHVSQRLVETAMLAAVSGLAYAVSSILKVLCCPALASVSMSFTSHHSSPLSPLLIWIEVLDW